MKNLYLILITSLLASCNLGAGTAGQPVMQPDNQTLTLESYVSMLSTGQSSAAQQSFILTQTTQLNSININYYSDNLCVTAIATTTLLPANHQHFVTYPPGIYKSTNLSNFALCGKFSSNNGNGCIAEYNQTKSIQFTYIVRNGLSTSVCLTTSNNTNSISNASAPCVESSSCGFNDTYTYTVPVKHIINSYDDTKIYSYYSGNLGGIAGADAKCSTIASDMGYYINTFKAFLAASTRQAIPNVNWIMQPNVTYVNKNNQIIGMSNGSAVFDFPLSSPIITANSTIMSWTGLNNTWQLETSCNDWTSIATGAQVMNAHGLTQWDFNSGANWCNSTETLTCVEQ